MSEEQIGVEDALEAINECLLTIGRRLDALEKYVSEMPTPDKTLYRPTGYEEYLNIKGNYDEIYRRIGELEGKANGV